MLGHHDLAAALAEHGIAAVAVEHAGDSFRDQSGFGTDRVLLGRPTQASAAIDAALAAPGLGDHVDARRIGAMGFSAGGYTALLLAGVRPDFDRLGGYCERHPNDAELCRGQIRRVLEHAPATADPRVRAVFAMAPLAVFFAPRDVADVQVPVFLAFATRDHVLLPEENAELLRRTLPSLAGVRVVDADHYVFLALCPPPLAERAPELCVDPRGVNRAAIHRQLARDATDFFSRALTPSAYHFHDASGRPIVRYETAWQIVHAFFGEATPPLVHVAFHERANSYFHPETSTVSISRHPAEKNPEIALVAHETAHLALARLTHGASTSEALRFLDEGLASIIASRAKGDADAYRSRAFVVAAQRAGEDDAILVHAARWSEYFGDPGMHPDYDAYDVGAAFDFFLMKEFGEGATRRLLTDLGDTRDLGRSCARVLGRGVGEIERLWRAGLEYVKVEVPRVVARSPAERRGRPVDDHRDRRELRCSDGSAHLHEHALRAGDLLRPRDLAHADRARGDPNEAARARTRIRADARHEDVLSREPRRRTDASHPLALPSELTPPPVAKSKSCAARSRPYHLICDKLCSRGSIGGDDRQSQAGPTASPE
jgi:dienelactone hydrolase